MRILHIIGTLDRRFGGPANSIRRIVSTYPQIESQPGSCGEVLTLDDPAASFLNEVDFPVHALGPNDNKFCYNARLIPWLVENRDRFDGVVVHGLWQYLGFATHRAIRGHKPYMVFTHGMLDPYFNRSSRLKQLKKIPYWLLCEYRVLRDADRVLFTSETEARLATQSFWPWKWNPCVVPYGATAHDGDPDQLRRSFLEHHPALAHPDGTAKPFILFLSRIHAKKGCDLLLKAFAHIVKSAGIPRPDLQLVFAGPDSDGLTQRLSELAVSLGVADRTHFIGMVDGDQKWGAFRACEVYALPSHQENFGIAVAEALACSKAVLLSDQVNIWQEIIGDGAGFAAPDTIEGTESTLIRWLTLTPEERSAMGQRALACFESRYDMRANARGIIEIFSEIAASRSTALLSTTHPAQAD